jgi:hypothetical protein
MDVRLDQVQQAIDRPIGKQHDVVHAAQGRNHFRTGVAVHHGPALTLQRPHRPIVVDGDDQPVCFAGGAGDVANVPDVEYVEAAVGERNRSSGAPVPGDRVDERVFRENAPHVRHPAPPAMRPVRCV